jgi:hypothetical protein
MRYILPPYCGSRMPKLGSYDRAIVLARPDRRTKEGRLLKSMRETLTAHLGGSLSAPQRALVDRAAMFQLRCAMRAASGMPPAAVKPAWGEPLSEALGGLTGKIAAVDVWRIIDKPASYRTQADNVEVGAAMRALGWDRTMQRFGMEPVSAYVRGVAAERRVPIYVFRDPITEDIVIYRTARERLFESTPIRVLRCERKRPFSVQ